jgi:hypothetical protein
VWVDKWKGIKKTVRGAVNGYVLCRPVMMPVLSHLDAVSGTQVDKTRGIIAFLSSPVKTYLRPEYSHIDDLRVGDEVLFDPKAANFLLERTESLATFNGNELYLVVNRRRIIAVLNR